MAWREGSIDGTVTYLSKLRDGFWPTTRVQASRVDQLDDDGEDREEFWEDEAYVGPLSGRPNPSFRVAQDLFKGYFVAV